MINKKSNTNELPALVMLVPEGAVLPDGFPIKAEGIYGSTDVVHTLSNLLISRDNKNRDGATDPVVALWMTDAKALRVAREITKHVDGVLFKALLNVPEADYNSSWMMLTSDLATYDVDQITAHVDMNDPAKQVDSKISAEAQEQKFEKHVDDLMDLLSNTSDGTDDLDDLGAEGVDDTGV